MRMTTQTTVKAKLNRKIRFTSNSHESTNQSSLQNAFSHHKSTSDEHIESRRSSSMPNGSRRSSSLTRESQQDNQLESSEITRHPRRSSSFTNLLTLTEVEFDIIIKRQS